MSKENAKASAPVHQLVGQLREMLAKATPGEWHTYDAATLNTRVYSTEPTIRNITVCRHPCASINARNDALLIAAMRNALPALLAIAEAAENACEEGPFVCDTSPMGVLHAALHSLPNAKAESASGEKP